MRVMLVLMMFLLSGCYTMTVKNGEPTPLTSKPTHEINRPMILGGLLSSAEPVSSEEMCQGLPVQQVQTYHSFVDFVLSVVTFQIYSPGTVRLWCEGSADPGAVPPGGKRGKKSPRIKGSKGKPPHAKALKPNATGSRRPAAKPTKSTKPSGTTGTGTDALPPDNF